MATGQTLRERLESTEQELVELKAANKAKPDFSDAAQVTKWFGEKIIEYMHLARRKEALQRLKTLSSALDSWSRILKLANDSSELENLKTELADLRQMVEAERKTGPKAVVR